MVILFSVIGFIIGISSIAITSLFVSLEDIIFLPVAYIGNYVPEMTWGIVLPISIGSSYILGRFIYYYMSLFEKKYLTPKTSKLISKIVLSFFCMLALYGFGLLLSSSELYSKVVYELKKQRGYWKMVK